MWNLPERWLQLLGFTAAILALVSAIILIAIVAVYAAGG